MNSDSDIKNVVKKKYGEIAAAPGTGCCGPAGPSCCEPGVGLDISDSYDDLAGYDQGADLSLGCGLPTATAGISEGQTVLDLGSGAGNDVFVARALVGASGKVIGLDMVPEMVAKARANNERLGHTNVEFLLGEIEQIPLPDASVDVVISNCVLNLVPNKPRAFAEIFRVLRPGGHFSISDVVLQGELPAAAASAAALYVGCVAGALQKDEYRDIITAAGFTDLAVPQEKPITLPESLLQEALGSEGAAELAASGVEILSVTVTGTRPWNRDAVPC